jgi:hypothetical protein
MGNASITTYPAQCRVPGGGYAGSIKLKVASQALAHGLHLASDLAPHIIVLPATTLVHHRAMRFTP